MSNTSATNGSACPFCTPDSARTFHEDALIVGLWDGFAVSPGHALLVLRRHVATWFDATPEEQAALVRGIDVARARILERHRPDGFNIGINVGHAAGQTVFHLHVHVIPRYDGDVPDPRGGVRHVIPSKANYLASPSPEATAGTQLIEPMPTESGLLSGPEMPLLPRLRDAIDRAVEVDLCVAFVLPSGVDLLWGHLRDLVRRKGRLRILTGDYLDVTDPDALAKLSDLGDGAEVRVIETYGRSFHPKGYLAGFADGSALAFIGSSNLSGSALHLGVEWNWQVVSARDRREVAGIRGAFDRLFSSPNARPVTEAWIQSYRARRSLPIPVPGTVGDSIFDKPEPREARAGVPKPTPIQVEALAALQASREAGNGAGLVVLATGLGKTWLAAFDSLPFQRVLFVAHRDEILEQARATFRRIRPASSLGKYTGTEKLPESDVLFASIQTLGREVHLRRFAPDRFDYVVVDEFHHAAARTYRALIDHFQPRFFLGLTATPDRSDGADLLALCGENLVYECDVVSGIRRGQLVPFHYFGVPDRVDYGQIPWRSGRFDEVALTAAVATRERAASALEQWRLRGRQRTLAFCVSQRHADFMAAYFHDNGVAAVAVHSGVNSAPRTRALANLEAGSIAVLFVVDLFNEGLDLPAIDTILMLRPTESVTLWTQQFGRGLRRSGGKSHLTVVDYVGNHRVFLTAPRVLLGLEGGDREMLLRIRSGEWELPGGCSIHYDVEAIDVLKELLRPRSRAAAVEGFYVRFMEAHGRRPTASEVWHAGYDPGVNPMGCWRALVEESEGRPLGLPSPVLEFLRHMETTPMTRSFKMVLLLGWIAAARESEGGAGESSPVTFPGEIGIQRLVAAFRRLTERSAVLRADVGTVLESDAALRRHLEEYPIHAWTGGRGTGGMAYFEYQGGVMRTASGLDVGTAQREVLVDWVTELAEWRLAEYLGRRQPRPFAAKVIQQSGKPILFFPDLRRRRPDIPDGWTPVTADGDRYEANFVKIAVNVLRREGQAENVLAEVLRRWFGPEAGKPGRRDQVRFKPGPGGVWVMEFDAAGG